jgi:hypothetical protein
VGDISLAALIRQGLFEEAAALAQAGLRANPARSIWRWITGAPRSRASIS